MRVHILYPVTTSPTGGGNQFLKGLRSFFKEQGVYEQSPDKADVVMFNSYQYTDWAARVKKRHPEKIFVHRIDGPIRLYNNMRDKRDDIVYAANRFLTDGSVFQSVWSQQKNWQLGLLPSTYNIVISNASDPAIFYPQNRTESRKSGKIRIIATSWSSNWRKGFAVYQWLDENLDFRLYEMVFVGNSPITFKRIQPIPPLTSQELAEELRKSDVFIIASQIESCSNSLIEALHCGLPVVAFNGSSYPGIVGKAGELFERSEQIPSLLKKIIQNYDSYQSNIRFPTMKEVGKAYYSFMFRIYQDVHKGNYVPKRISNLNYLRMWSKIFCSRLKEKFATIKDRF